MNVADIITKSEAVGALARARDEAFDDERDAAADLLNAVVDAVHPDAMRLLCGRIGPTDVRGVALATGRNGAVLYLTSAKEWCTVFVDGVPTAACTDDVVRLFDVAKVIGSLSEKLDQHLHGDITKRIAAAHARADQFRAITILLRVSK